MAHLLPHPARPHRWWTATAGASRSAGDLPAQEAWHSDGGLWAWHYPRTYSRPYPRRLDHRQLHMALDLLPQPAGRHVFGADDQRLRTRPTLHREKQDRRSRLVGHRLPGTWIRDAATRTRHGPAQRLVRQQSDQGVDGALHLRTRRYGDTRVEGPPPH